MNAEALLTSLGQAGIIVAVFDDRLRLTGNLSMLTDNMRAFLREQKPALMELLSNHNRPACWLSLAESGRSDLDVDNLDEALFLFALRKIKATPALEHPAMRRQFDRYWKRRLHREAYKILASISGTPGAGCQEGSPL